MSQQTTCRQQHTLRRTSNPPLENDDSSEGSRLSTLTPQGLPIGSMQALRPLALSNARDSAEDPLLFRSESNQRQPEATFTATINTFIYTGSWSHLKGAQILRSHPAIAHQSKGSSSESLPAMAAWKIRRASLSRQG